MVLVFAATEQLHWGDWGWGPCSRAISSGSSSLHFHHPQPGPGQGLEPAPFQSQARLSNHKATTAPPGLQMTNDAEIFGFSSAFKMHPFPNRNNTHVMTVLMQSERSRVDGIRNVLQSSPSPRHQLMSLSL